MNADSPMPAGNPRFYALIPCAGHGSRAGTAVPKQYWPVAGKALVLHTLAAFLAVPRLTSILVLAAPHDTLIGTLDATKLIAAHAHPERARGTFSLCGGETRAATVANGLRELLRHGAHGDDWVLVHDAARCLITPGLIDRLIDACMSDPVGGLLAVPLADTLRREENGRGVQTLPRGHKWLAQTPQMFRIGLLVQALERALERALEKAGTAVTDEAGAVEALGLHPLLVPGAAHNFKVTWPDDFALAEAVLAGRLQQGPTP